MTIPEFHQRQNINGKILIQVLNHKTASSMGPANLIITPNEEAMMLYLQMIRWKIVPQKDEFSNRFFLTNTGNEFRKISEIIQSLKTAIADLVGDSKFLTLCDHWRKRSENVPDDILADIYDGAIWKDFNSEKYSNFLKYPGNLLLSLNTDWFQPFSRTKYSVFGCT